MVPFLVAGMVPSSIRLLYLLVCIVYFTQKRVCIMYHLKLYSKKEITVHLLTLKVHYFCISRNKKYILKLQAKRVPQLRKGNLQFGTSINTHTISTFCCFGQPKSSAQISSIILSKFGKTPLPIFISKDSFQKGRMKANMFNMWGLKCTQFSIYTNAVDHPRHICCLMFVFQFCTETARLAIK